jgi:carbon-monoxide dehydrogenase medium subunit
MYPAKFRYERRIGDFATADVAVALELSGDRVNRAGLGMTEVGPRTLEATTASDYLNNRSLTASVIDEASRLTAEAAQPRGDHRGSSEYKRHIVYTVTNRLLRSQIELAA